MLEHPHAKARIAAKSNQEMGPFECVVVAAALKGTKTVLKCSIETKSFSARKITGTNCRCRHNCCWP
eukprot:5781108-Amphidinium_carterae.1